MKRYIFLILALLMIFQCSAQITPVGNGYYHNLEKYWWYRYRLVNDFMKIGDQCSESIPAQRKEAQHDTVGRYFMRLCWGDATQSLGHYIGVVAAESKLLNLYGWDANRSNKELYLALKAFDRLDLNAEELMNDMKHTDPCDIKDRKVSGSFNGFFIRDDVKEDLLLNNQRGFNRPGLNFQPPVDSMQSDYF